MMFKKKPAAPPQPENALDSHRLGVLGETLAAASYREQEYIILDSNFRCRFGEVDLIVFRDEQLVFVEVRTRREGSMLTPAETVDKHKQRRLIAAAEYYLLNNPELNNYFMRFDVVEAYYQGGYCCKLNRIENAFTL